MASYGVAATRDATIYGIGIAALLPFGLISLAVTTRFLDPTGYGQLATLMAVAALLTLFAGMGVIQGTLMTVYRAGEDGADGADAGEDSGMVGDLEVGPEDHLTPNERRRLLGSGIVFSAVQAGVICLPVAIAADHISTWLLGNASGAGAVRWMAVSAFMGALWRMCHQVWRMERHPVIWVWFQLARPLLVVGGIVIAFSAGLGLEAPLIATSAGTAVVVFISLVASSNWYLLRPRIGDYGIIWSRGRSLVPIQIASVIQSNIAVLVLAALAPAATVGVFAVALRIAQIPSFFAHGVLLAWPPLGNSPIGLAFGQMTTRGEAKARIFSLLFLGTLGLLVVVSLGSTAFVRVAASSYGAAADYVPILAAAAAGLVVFRGIYRATNFPFRRAWYVGLHFFWIFPYMLVLVALLPIGPTWAVMTAELLASITICLIMALVDRLSEAPTPFRWRQLLTTTAIAGAVLATVDLSPTGGWARAGLALAMAIALPVLVVRTGVVARNQAKLALNIVGGVLPRPMGARNLAEHLESSTEYEREAIDALLWQRLDPELAALQSGISKELLCARMVRGLRRIGEVEGASPHDAVIGEYLLLGGTNIIRDDIARSLARQGVDPHELHLLHRRVLTLRRVRRRGKRVLRRVEMKESTFGLPG
jgi:O-antigen/teichoic acid export membrane protein